MLANLLQEFAAPLTKEQVTKVKDALGDLSLEQVNWLSGYLAGVAATGAAAGIKDIRSVIESNGAISQTTTNALAQSASSEAASAKIATILYGSQTGNARGIAEQVYQSLQAENIEAELVDMAEFNPKHLKKLQRVFLVVSTHGEGEPPDDAIELHEFVTGKKAPKLDHLEFSVLALGDSSYEFFCQTGKDFDLAFERAGATRLLERVDCDVDYQQFSETWRDELLALAKSSGESSSDVDFASQVAQKPHLSVVTKSTEFTKFNPLLAEVVDVVTITSNQSTKKTYHIEIDLGDSGVTYLPGDALGVWPLNRSELVEEVLNHFAWSGEEVISTPKGDVSLRSGLTEVYELTQVPPSFVKWLAEKINDESLVAMTQSASELKELLAVSQIPDLLRRSDSAEYRHSLLTVQPQEFVEQLRAITPRLYSIASSQKEVDEEVHLTVGLVIADHNGIERSGAASDYLSQLESGEEVRVYIEPNKHFKLPEDPAQPIIMIGAGTGIAPFRGFIQEREHSESTAGESWLFFGNQHFADDFLYQLEWQGYLKSGALSKIDLAFSRDQQEKVYVQHKLRSHAQEVYQWIQKGAHIYLCGDKDRLGKSVEQTLIEIISEQGLLTEEQAKQELLNLKKLGRYQKDVY